jgi:hypothetical protein
MHLRKAVGVDPLRPTLDIGSDSEPALQAVKIEQRLATDDQPEYDSQQESEAS